MQGSFHKHHDMHYSLVYIYMHTIYCLHEYTSSRDRRLLRLHSPLMIVIKVCHNVFLHSRFFQHFGSLIFIVRVHYRKSSNILIYVLYKHSFVLVLFGNL
jgi:hypothetical protein